MSKKNIYFNSYFPNKKKNKAKISYKKKINYHIKNTIEKIRSKNNYFLKYLIKILNLMLS